MSFEDVRLEHQRLRREVAKARRDPMADTLGAVIMRAVKEAEDLRSAGADAAAVASGLESVVRQRWPKRRQEPWHFDCKLCDGTGWRVKECTAGARCGRPFKLPKASEDDWTGRGKCGEWHSYVEPCLCDPGRSFRANLLKEPRTSEDAVEMAARVSKPTKFGR